MTALPPGVEDEELEQLLVESNASVACTRSLLTALTSGRIELPEVTSCALTPRPAVVPPAVDVQQARLRQRLEKAGQILKEKRAESIDHRSVTALPGHRPSPPGQAPCRRDTDLAGCVGESTADPRLLADPNWSLNAAAARQLLKRITSATFSSVSRLGTAGGSCTIISIRPPSSISKRRGSTTTRRSRRSSVGTRAQLQTFVEHENLDDFLALLEGVSLLVSFNGSTFDVPRVLNAFHIPALGCGHLDLRWSCYHQGYTGGLKEITRQMDIHRPADLQDADGQLAVQLWHAWQMHQDPVARDQLIRYCAADVLLLVVLAERLTGPRRTGRALVASTAGGGGPA